MAVAMVPNVPATGPAWVPARCPIDGPFQRRGFDMSAPGALEQARNFLAIAERRGDQREVAAALAAVLVGRVAAGEPIEPVLRDTGSVLSNPHLVGVARIDLLIEVSIWEMSIGERDCAVASALEARRLALAINDDFGAAWATARAGMAAVYSKVDRDLVLEVLDDAIRRFRALDLTFGAALAHVFAGMGVLFTMNDHARSLGRFAQARELVVAERPCDRALLAACSAFEATALAGLGRVDEATARHAESLRYGDVTFPGITPLRWFAGGVIALAANNPAGAIPHFIRAATQAAAEDARELHVEIVRRHAQACQRLGDNSHAGTLTSEFRAVRKLAEARSFTQSWWDLVAHAQTFG